MKASIALWLLACLFTLPLVAHSQGRTSDTPFFSAEVVNIDKTQSGKIFVTVLFISKVYGKGFQGSVANVRLTRGSDDCSKAATLLDGAGNEYSTNRCLPHRNSLVNLNDRRGGDGRGIVLEEASKSQFVFEFTTPLANRDIRVANFSLMVPIYFEVTNHRTPNFYEIGQATLSFFRLSAT